MNLIKTYKGEIPQIDTPQMIEVDRLMIEEYHIELIQMMENAGRCLAIVARDRFFDGNPSGKKVTVLAGTGGNGGGALVCARRLKNWGAQVEVYLTAPADKMTPIPHHQLTILNHMGVSVQSGEELGSTIEADLIIDGIIGYSISGDPFGLPKMMIEWANGHAAPTLALDTPSGLDLTSGTIHTPTIEATATLTLALPKKGLFPEPVQAVRGALYLGDISVPPSLYAKPSLGVEVPNIFAESDVLRIS